MLETSPQLEKSSLQRGSTFSRSSQQQKGDHTSDSSVRDLLLTALPLRSTAVSLALPSAALQGALLPFS